MTASKNTLRSVVTRLAATLFVALGVWLMVEPRAVERLYALRLENDMAVSEMRAVFGGMMAGIGGAVLILDLVIGRARDAALVLAMVALGLVAARIVGFAFEGWPSGPVLNETIFEVALLAVLTLSGAFQSEKQAVK